MYHTLNAIKCLKRNYGKLLLLSHEKSFTKLCRFMHLVQTKLLTSMMWPEMVSHICDILLFEGSERFWNLHIVKWPKWNFWYRKLYEWKKKFQGLKLHLIRSESPLKYFTPSYGLFEKKMLHHVLQQIYFVILDPSDQWKGNIYINRTSFMQRK